VEDHRETILRQAKHSTHALGSVREDEVVGRRRDRFHPLDGIAVVLPAHVVGRPARYGIEPPHVHGYGVRCLHSLGHASVLAIRGDLEDKVAADGALDVLEIALPLPKPVQVDRMAESEMEEPLVKVISPLGRCSLFSRRSSATT